MDLEVVRALVDVSGYLGALTAGVAGNALWDGARGVFELVRGRLTTAERTVLERVADGSASRHDLDIVLAAVERELTRDVSILNNTVYAIGGGSSVANSIIVVNPGAVGDISQTNG